MLTSSHTTRDENPDFLQHFLLTSASEHRMLVLVVEDDLQMARMTAATLATIYRVSTACDGHEGLEQALALRPDIILCDVSMPRMDGEQLVAELRALPDFDDVPIMVLSGRTDEQSRIQLLRAGAQDYLIKPFNREELRTRIANLLMMRQVRRILQGVITTQTQNPVTLANEVARRQRDLTLAHSQLQEREVTLQEQAKALILVNANLEEANHALSHARDTVCQLAAIVESSGEAIFSKTLEGVITSWNRSAETLFGYRAEEIIGQSVSILIPSAQLPALEDILARTRLGQQPIKDYETIRIRKDGTHVSISATISPILDHHEQIIGSSTIARDITEHKQMERELAKRRDEREQIMRQLESTNQQLYGLFEHAPAGLVLFDARPPYKVLFHNTVFKKYYPEPFHSAGMLGKYLPDFMLASKEEGILEIFHEVVRTGQGKTMLNFVYDGMLRGRTWWNWHLALVIKDGKVTALTEMVIETTPEVLAKLQLETELAERRRAEDALIQSHSELLTVNAALEQANQVRSQFLATMSHELRTPLTAIIGFSEMLLQDARIAGADQEQQSSLESILNNSEHLLGLINNVLDFSKMQAGQMVLDTSQVDPKALLVKIAAELQSTATRRNLFLRTEVQEGLDCLETNPVNIHQILLGLTSNALKFTNQGGVTLSASRVLRSDKATAGVAFAVKDTGIGIAPDLHQRIFEPLYQADMSYTRKAGGTGMGLALVDRLTGFLGGTITVESTPGQGSTFTVTLPIRTTP